MTRGPFVSRALLFFLTLVLGAALTPASVDAQYFGRNKVQYKTFDTRVLETEHFDIYYYPEMETIVGEAGRMAERWYARVARLLDHELKGRQALILYASHPDFEQTNAVFGEIGESTGGVTEVLKRRIVLPLAGTLNESDHVLGHELVHAFQFDITSLTGEGGIGFRGPTALLLPLWFVEGMAEYLSVGPVDAHTAMWMRDAAACNCRLPTLRDLTTRQWEYFPYRWGQAFWAFVAGKWGDEAIGKVLKVAGRSGNPEQALEAVLQIPIPQLEAEWHQAIYEAYSSVAEDALGDEVDFAFGDRPAYGAEDEGDEDVKQMADLKDLPPLPQHGNATQLVSQSLGGGGLNVGPSVSPDGSRVVFLSEKDLFAIEMFLADAETGEVIRRLTKAAVDSHMQSLQFINSSGAWSPDGRNFAFGVVIHGHPAITIVEAETGDNVQEIRFKELGEIYTPSYSPDGRSLVFAAIVNGYTDLFILDLETEPEDPDHGPEERRPPPGLEPEVDVRPALGADSEEALPHPQSAARGDADDLAGQIDGEESGAAKRDAPTATDHVDDDRQREPEGRSSHPQRPCDHVSRNGDESAAEHRLLASDVVPEHQLLRVRLEVELADEIVDVVAVDVVTEHGDRHDERHQTLTVVLDEPDQLLALGRIDDLFQVPDGVLQDVGVTLRRRPELEIGEELVFVFRKDLGVGSLTEGRDDLSEPPISGLVVRPQQHLVRGVKGDQSGTRQSDADQ